MFVCNQIWIQFSHIHTLVLKKITHSCSTSQDKLRDILYNLGLGLWGHGWKPFREADFAWYRDCLICFSLDYPSTKPTLSRNEKDVVDHKITQPHLSRDSSHALGRSMPSCSDSLVAFHLHHSSTLQTQQTHIAILPTTFFYYSCQELEWQDVSSRNRFWAGVIFFSNVLIRYKIIPHWQCWTLNVERWTSNVEVDIAARVLLNICTRN